MASRDRYRWDLDDDCWMLQYPEIPEELRLDVEKKKGENSFRRIWKTHPEEFEKVKVFSKVHDTPRWMSTYGRDYTFSKMSHESKPIDDPYLMKLVAWVNRHAHKHLSVNEELSYNGVLVNFLEDGYHYVGAHSDSEKQLVPNMPIYSFSFGATRTFRVTAKDKSMENLDVEMPHNTLLVMGGKMQKRYKHEVPKALKIKKKRINITVRIFKE